MNSCENNLTLAEERFETHVQRLFFANFLVFGIVMVLGGWFGSAHYRPRTPIPNLVENFGMIVLPMLAGAMFVASVVTKSAEPILFSTMNTALALLLSFIMFVYTFCRDFAPDGFN